MAVAVGDDEDDGRCTGGFLHTSPFEPTSGAAHRRTCPRVGVAARYG